MGCGASDRGTRVVDISSMPSKYKEEQGVPLASPGGIATVSSQVTVQPTSPVSFNGALVSLEDINQAVSERGKALSRRKSKGVSTPLTKSEVLHIAEGPTRSAQRVHAVTSLDVQQPMNCCNVTALAFSLSSLGIKTSIDDIMVETDLEPTAVVHDGLTLAQTYVLATTYVTSKAHCVFARCYHFDAEFASLEGFWEEVSANVADTNTVFVLNFHSGIAHGKPKGGGHFAVVAATTVVDGRRELVMSDVHPLKYGRYWSTSAQRMFSAMVDKDSNSQRSRGMLVLHRGEPRTGLWPRLCPMTRAVSWETPEADLGLEWKGRGAELRHFVPSDFHDVAMSPNLSGASALTLALVAIDGRAWTLRKVMRSTGGSYTHHLNHFLSLQALRQMAEGFCCIDTSVVALEQTTDSSKAAAELLKDLAGSMSETSAALLRFDVNVAYGCAVVGGTSAEASVLTHGAQKWAAVAAVDIPGGRIVLADPHPISMTRLWWCYAKNMLEAMRAIRTEGFLVVAKKKKTLT